MATERPSFSDELVLGRTIRDALARRIPLGTLWIVPTADVFNALAGDERDSPSDTEFRMFARLLAADALVLVAADDLTPGMRFRARLLSPTSRFADHPLADVGGADFADALEALALQLMREPLLLKHRERTGTGDRQRRAPSN